MERCEWCHNAIEEYGDLKLRRKLSVRPGQHEVIICMQCDSRLKVRSFTAAHDAEKLFYYECLDKTWPRD